MPDEKVRFQMRISLETDQKVAAAMKLTNSQSKTEKQKELIEQLTREFPLSRGLFEHSDFMQSPTQGNASEFIARALEDNLD